MARTKGSKNKTASMLPTEMSLSLEERLDILANLIAERILDDQQNGGKLLKELKGGKDVRTI